MKTIHMRFISFLNEKSILFNSVYIRLYKLL